MIGVSAITLLAIIYKYVQNLFNPKQKMIEGQMSFDERYGTGVGDNSSILAQSGSQLAGLGQQSDGTLNIQDFLRSLSNNFQSGFSNQSILLQGIYDELGEFNHIYQERMFEQILPSQIRKTIIHLSSIDHTDILKVGIGEYTFALTRRPGLNPFNSVINMKLLGAQMPYVQNIYAETTDPEQPSNELYFSASSVTVPPGHYTIDNLIIALNASMATGGISGSFSFDNITKLVKLNGNLSGISASGTLYKKLGFGNGNLNHSASNIADLSIHYIDVSYDGIHPRGATLTNSTGVPIILKRIPLNGQPGDIIFYDTPPSDYLSQDLFMPDSNANISSLKINLHRHDSTPYNLMGLHFDLKLEITELIEPTLLTEMESHMRRDRTRFFEKDASQAQMALFEGAAAAIEGGAAPDKFYPDNR